MQPIPSAWEILLKKYGVKATFIEGGIGQPIYQFQFGLNYSGTIGQLTFTWNQLITDDLAYNAKTILLLELPVQQNRLKIFHTGKIINFFSKLHPNKTTTGCPDFDNAFITIAKPASIVSKLMPYLLFLLNPTLGGSLALDTDWQDAVTTRFYLRLQVNRLLREEMDIEAILEGSHQLVKQLMINPIKR